jgi:hypothetical protein
MKRKQGVRFVLYEKVDDSLNNRSVSHHYHGLSEVELYPEKSGCSVCIRRRGRSLCCVDRSITMPTSGTTIPVFELFVSVIFLKISTSYILIAQNRYQLFGKKNECMLPSDELRRRFLQQRPG